MVYIHIGLIKSRFFIVAERQPACFTTVCGALGYFNYFNCPRFALFFLQSQLYVFILPTTSLCKFDFVILA